MRPLLCIALCSLLPYFLLPAVAQEMPKKETASPFIRDKEPELSKETGYEMPPGPEVPEGDAKVEHGRTWKLKNGRSIRMSVSYWIWKKMTKPDGAAFWQVCLAGDVWDEKESPRKQFLAEEFDPAEAPYIMKAVWEVHHFQTRHLRAEQKYIKEADAWLDRIASYTGTEPREPGKPWLPESSDSRMKKAPDIRKPWSWDLRRGGRWNTAARFSVVDWAVPEKVAVSKSHLALHGKGFAIPVRVKYEDGTEEVLAAGWIGDSDWWGFFQMGLWNDWARLRAQGGEIPHRDAKISALRDLLPELWYRELSGGPPVRGPGVPLSPLEQVSPADFAERSKGFRQGERLSFPGLPPQGYQRIDTNSSDRLILGNMPQGPVGAGARQCLGFGMAEWMNSWQKMHLVSVPGVIDFGANEWFYARVPKEMPSLQRAALFWPAFAKRINDYGAGLYHKQAIFQVHWDLDYSPTNLVRYVQGMDAVFLSLTVLEGRTQTPCVALPLLRAFEDGTVFLGAYGGVIEGSLIENKTGHLPVALGAVKGRLPAMEIVINKTPDDAAKKLKNVRLVLESNLQDGIIVVTPYLRKGAAK